MVSVENMCVFIYICMCALYMYNYNIYNIIINEGGIKLLFWKGFDFWKGWVYGKEKESNVILF